MKEAMFYEALTEERVRCTLCSHECVIQEGKRGICGVRVNREGKLYSEVYGRIIAEHVDPIEKKPLFHFKPGSRAYSIGTIGCNFHCKHCQNSDIAQYRYNDPKEIIGRSRKPEKIVSAAKDNNCESVAYTYNEPTVFYEFAYDTAVLAQESGIKNIFVSNGYLSAEASRHIAAYLDAINIDLKTFNNSSYKEVCGASLDPVLETISLMKSLSVWVEITTLIIPDLNDGEDELRGIAQFIKSVSPEIPWHVTGFYPAYKYSDRPPTEPATLYRARRIGLEEGLNYVYTGNIADTKSASTYCPSCGTLVIERRGGLIKNVSKNGKCPECGASIPGVDI